MNGTIYVITEARLLSVAEFLVFKFGERAIGLARLVLHVLAFVGIVENRVTFTYIYQYLVSIGDPGVHTTTKSQNTSGILYI